jgi:hypothetical protein
MRSKLQLLTDATVLGRNFIRINSIWHELQESLVSQEKSENWKSVQFYKKNIEFQKKKMHFKGGL